MGEKATELFITRGIAGSNPVTQGQLAYIKRTTPHSPKPLNFGRDLLSGQRLVFYLLSDGLSLNALLKHQTQTLPHTPCCIYVPSLWPAAVPFVGGQGQMALKPIIGLFM